MPAGSLPDRARVLLIRPDHIGDLLMATPAIRWLRGRLPDARIEMLCGPWSAPAVADNPDLDLVETLAFPGLTRSPKSWPGAPYAEALRSAKRLREGKYDVVVILRFDHWWGAMVAYLADIPRRIGYSVAECRPFLTEAVPYAPGLPEVAQNLRLVGRGLDGAEERWDPADHPMRFEVSEADRAFASARVDAFGARPILIVHPGAGAPVKHYPPRAYSAVANQLAEEFGVGVIVTGTAAERRVVEAVVEGIDNGATALTGATLSQVAAILERGELVIGADSGILHLAVAVGTPTIAMYGPVDSKTFGPWGDPVRHVVVKSDLACIPCNRLDYTSAELPEHPCIRMIEKATLVRAARPILAGRSHADRN